MDIFSLLIQNILPLYIIMFLGFCGSKFLDIEPRNISRFVIYLVSPFVVFEAAMRVPFEFESFIPPLLYILISLSLMLIAFGISPLIFKDKNRVNLFMVACSVKNSGYFGIPIVLMLFPIEISSIYILATMGGLFLEVTVNFYILARHNFDAKESLNKLLTLPALYAFILGFALNSQNITIPTNFDTVFVSFKGTLIILGMAIIGLNIGRLDKLKFDLNLLTPTLLVHIFIWPIITYGWLFLDYHFLHVINPEYHILFLLIACLPVAANITIYASELNVMPASAATLVLISTLLGVAFVPLAMYLMPNLLIDPNLVNVAY